MVNADWLKAGALVAEFTQGVHPLERNNWKPSPIERVFTSEFGSGLGLND